MRASIAFVIVTLVSCGGSKPRGPEKVSGTEGASSDDRQLEVAEEVVGGEEPAGEETASATSDGASRDIDKEAIRANVREKLARFEYCYDSYRGRAGDVEASLTASFVIDRHGTVTSATLSKSSGDDELDTCVIDAFKSISFSVPGDGNIEITDYPFLFTP